MSASCKPVFEKTCETTPKNVKSRVFLDFEKYVKNFSVGLHNLYFHRPLNHSNFTITLNFGVGNLAVLTSGN